MDTAAERGRGGDNGISVIYTNGGECAVKKVLLANGCDPDLLQSAIRKQGSLDGKHGWEETEAAALKPYCDHNALEHIFWSQAKITQVGHAAARPVLCRHCIVAYGTSIDR